MTTTIEALQAHSAGRATEEIVSRAVLIARLTAMTDARTAEGMPIKVAWRAVATEVGMTRAAVRRLIDLYPDD